jgi:hypothetical protein
MNFPTRTKNWHNRITVLYTKYVRNTNNYFPPEPKKEKICIEQENSYKINFPATTKKMTQPHNCIVL